jgi:hypothetical protein
MEMMTGRAKNQELVQIISSQHASMTIEPRKVKAPLEEEQHGEDDYFAVKDITQQQHDRQSRLKSA